MRSLEEKRQKAIRLRIVEGLSLTAICKILEVRKGTAYYWIRNNPLPPKPQKYNTKIDWAEVQAYYDAGHSWRETKERFGYHGSTWSNAVRQGYVIARPKAKPLQQYLVKNRVGHQTCGVHLKNRLLRAGLLTDECYFCGISQWRGKKLNLELDHINGDGNDNRLENLRLLCPNCHSQTETFCGKNTKVARMRALPNNRS